MTVALGRNSNDAHHWAMPPKQPKKPISPGSLHRVEKGVRQPKQNENDLDPVIQKLAYAIVDNAHQKGKLLDHKGHPLSSKELQSLRELFHRSITNSLELEDEKNKLKSAQAHVTRLKKELQNDKKTLEALNKRVEELKQEENKLIQERDAAQAREDAARAEKEAARAEKEAARAEKEAARARKEAANLDLRTMSIWEIIGGATSDLKDPNKKQTILTLLGPYLQDRNAIKYDINTKWIHIFDKDLIARCLEEFDRDECNFNRCSAESIADGVLDGIAQYQVCREQAGGEFTFKCKDPKLANMYKDALSRAS